MRLLAGLLLLIATAAFADPVPYELRTSESRVGFTWFLNNEAISGRMPVARADIQLDFDRVGSSRVNVTVDAARANAGAPFAGEAMKGQSVLWTARFPEITFVSRRVRRDGAGGAIVEGDLTVRGVTRPQVLTARLFRPPGTEPGDRSRLPVRLEGTLSRAAFGADGFQSFVGDRVDLNISARIDAAR